MTTKHDARMATSAPLTPEQIRAVHRDHETLMRNKRRIHIRTAVRFVFWTAVTLAILTTLGHFHLLPDDYRDTCEALGQTCAP